MVLLNDVLLNDVLLNDVLLNDVLLNDVLTASANHQGQDRPPCGSDSVRTSTTCTSR
ncbi:hypothetical protein [Microbacterium rhizomatis]|uniref:hypothetical protein n=1 Tax=Microbacterium rhizomatis TaxID=1631477 RepID=UPI001478173C|nr:hypothetical protein [Microbacterium rhizomatis]